MLLAAGADVAVANGLQPLAGQPAANQVEGIAGMFWSQYTAAAVGQPGPVTIGAQEPTDNGWNIAVNRPGFAGGSDSTEGWGHASAEEVSSRVA